MKRYLINLGLSNITFAVLAVVAQKIHDGFVAMIAIFGTPNPTMLVFKGHIDDLTAALAKWGTKGNRGSKTDYNALVAAANIVKNDLRMLADYATNTAPNDPDTWMLVGFEVRRQKSKPVVLPAVQNLRQFLSPHVLSTDIKIRWKRPLDTQRTDVKVYQVIRNNVGIYPGLDGHGLVNVIGAVTAAAFVDVDPLVGENWYWIIPVNAAGFGEVSLPLRVVSTKLK